MGELGKLVDPGIWTDTKDAIKATLDCLLTENLAIDESYNCMDELEELTATADITESGSRESCRKVIIDCASKRKRQASDEKMTD